MRNLYKYKYKRHLSIHKIDEKYQKNHHSYYHHEIAIKCLKKLRIMIQQEDILVGIVMESKFIFSKILSKMFNFYIDNNPFANGLKEADIKSVCKNNDCFDKTNYRPISILPLLLKVFEPCL